MLFGGAGDLATRHLLPALLHLRRHQQLPHDFSVLGVGRDDLTPSGYRELVERALRSRVPEATDDERTWLLGAVDYVSVELTERTDLRAVSGSGPTLFYCALPPWAYRPVLIALARAGLPRGSRLVLEKPVGEDLTSAQEVHRLAHSLVDEGSVFRVDHFLHHQVVQDVLCLRLANPFLRAAWSHEHIESVEILWEESEGVRERAAYFDRAGTVKDMMQSHLLQLLALVAMELPSRWEAGDLPIHREAALRQVRSIDAREANSRTMRARYVAGQVHNQPVEAYASTPGVLAERATETYAAVALEVDAARWQGVPFVLRSGQAIGSPRRHIEVRFRAVPGAPAGHSTVLRLEMVPSQITLEMAVVGSDGFPDLTNSALTAQRPEQSLPASARLIRDVLAGRQGLFVTEGEVEQCWRVTDSVASAWAAAGTPLVSYAAGSSAPRMPPGVLSDVCEHTP